MDGVLPEEWVRESDQKFSSEGKSVAHVYLQQFVEARTFD